jgi:hypothetical protein
MQLNQTLAKHRFLYSAFICFLSFLCIEILTVSGRGEETGSIVSRIDACARGFGQDFRIRRMRPDHFGYLLDGGAES